MMDQKTIRARREAEQDPMAHMARVLAALAMRNGGVLSISVDELDALGQSGEHLDCAYDPERGYLFSITKREVTPS